MIEEIQREFKFPKLGFWET